MKLKKLFYQEKIIQTDQDPERILCSLRSAAFPSKYDLFSKDAFHFKAGAARGGNRLYIAFHVRGRVVPDFSSHRNHVVFSVQPPLCSYIGLMLFTAAAVYSFISLLIYPHALPVCLIACIFEILYITNIKWQITACEEKIIRHLRDQTELIQRADSEIE